ncbi:MAG: MBL fold metallo-hydrolase [Synergistaceae bacterium]|nr:MBL fold metallo-hydrolase [Synergistaceae bacterium]
MKPVSKDLYQHSAYVPQINLSFNQFLLDGDEPLLVHTGTNPQTEALLPRLKEALGGRPLKYIFVSHFEGDECGGLPLLLEEYPDAVTVCPEVTARQFAGFGQNVKTLVKKPREKLTTKDYELEFISYPSEMHLWEGLLAMENRRGIFFSCDLMIRRGDGDGVVIDSGWEAEISGIRHEQIPDPARLEALQKTLRTFSPSFVAAGHGPCIRLA